MPIINKMINNFIIQNKMTLKKSQKQLFKKTNLAVQLIEQVPLKFKKKIRQLIDQYEKQRIILLTQINKLGNQNVEFYLKNSAQTSETEIKVHTDSDQTIIQRYKQKIAFIQQQNYAISEQNRHLQEQVLKKQLLIENNYSQLNQIKSTLAYLRENLQFQENQFSGKIDILTKQIQQYSKITSCQVIQIKELQLKLQQLNEIKQKKEIQVNELKSSLHKIQSNFKQVSNELKKKKVIQITNILNKKQHNQSNNNYLTPNYGIEYTEQRSVHNSFRKQSQILNRSGGSKKSNGIIDLNESLKKIKQKIKNRNFNIQMEISDAQSIQFGKQKVIQKKKIKKLFLQLLNCDKSKKKQKAIKIANEIYLKSQQIQQFTGMFA